MDIFSVAGGKCIHLLDGYNVGIDPLDHFGQPLQASHAQLAAAPAML